MLPLGELVAPPCQACELRGQAWQWQPVPASWPRPRQCKWQMGWGPLGKKGGKIGEVACGSLIESRSGLSWWGGGDDREGRMAGVGEDYKAFGSLIHPVGWPQVCRSQPPPGHTHTDTHTPPSVFLISLLLLPLFSVSCHPSLQRSRGARHAYRSSRGRVKISQKLHFKGPLHT